MLSHIEEMLPSTMHLPILSEDTLHSCRYLHTHILIADEQLLLLINGYLHTHILIANEQFLLLINVPIQDHAQQMEISMKYLIRMYLTDTSQHALQHAQQDI